MVTGSNTIPAPGSSGNFVEDQVLTMVFPTPTTQNPTNFTGTLIGVPVTSTSGGIGATVDIFIAVGIVQSVTINQTGQGYTAGGNVFISSTDINNFLP